MSDVKKIVDLAALREEYEEALFRVAMVELGIERSEAAMAELEQGREDGSTGRLEEMALKARPRVYELIDREARKGQVKQFVKRTLPKVSVAAAAVILVGTIGVASAFALSSTVRSSMLRLLIRIDKQYTEIQLVSEQGKEFDVPAVWDGDFYLSQIPKGFTIVSVDSFAGKNDVKYAHPDGAYLEFHEKSVDSVSRIDSEDAVVSHVQIHGNEALASEKNGIVTIVWSEYDRYFLLANSGSLSETLVIAENVKKIIK